MTTTAEWVEWYQSLSARLLEAHAKLGAESQKILELAAQGRITPEVVQQHLPKFLQDQAVEHYAQLLQLGARFFAAALEIQSRQQTAFLSAALDKPITSFPEPPDFEFQDPNLWFEALAAYALRMQKDTAAQYQELLDKIAAGELTPEAVRRRCERFIEAGSSDYLLKLVEEGVRFYLGLTDLAASWSAKFAHSIHPDTDRQDIRLELG